MIAASRYKEESGFLRMKIQDLKQQLADSEEEMDEKRRYEAKREDLKRENSKLQQQAIILTERLRKAEDKADFLVEEKMFYWDTFKEQEKLLEISAQYDLEKKQSLHNFLLQENNKLHLLNDDLSDSVRVRDNQLNEFKLQIEQAQRSFVNRKRALDDHIFALEKVNSKLEEALSQRNGRM